MYDEFCYDPQEITQSGEIQTTENTVTDTDIFPTGKIKSIVYDPPGKDSDNESITLELIDYENSDPKKRSLSVSGKKI